MGRKWLLVTLLVLFFTTIYLQFFESAQLPHQTGTQSASLITDNEHDYGIGSASRRTVQEESAATKETRISKSIQKQSSKRDSITQEYGSVGKNMVTDDAHPEDPGPQLFIEPSSLIGAANGILLQAGTIDTDKGSITTAIPENLRFDPTRIAPGELIRYLVQFTGPVQQHWKEFITEVGGVLGNYIPNNCFVISLTPRQHEIVSSYSFVRWTDYYHPLFKLSENLSDSELLHKAKRTIDRGVVGSSVEESGANTVDSEKILLAVQTFKRDQLHYLYGLTKSIEGSAVINASDTRKSRIILEVPTQDLEQILILLAQASEVEWIEPFVPPTINNDEMVWVVQQNNPGDTGLWDKNLTGVGQIIGVGDTGLDVDMVFFWDETQGIPNSTVNLSQRKVISYHDLAGNGDWDSHDHGTHVAGTIAGKSTSVNSAYNGVAYEARLVVQDIGNGGSLTGIPGDLNTYFQQAYNDGARIHSNSWGAAVNGAYTAYAQDADEFMWNHKDFLIVFSAGNEGAEVNTIGSPGTAKNVLTSGASENGHIGYDQENVAYFSSNGPTDDGRIKPTVTAPGHYISSADSDGNISSYNSSVQTMSGTSMSAPSHAGSAALIRQYYIDGFFPSGVRNPSDSITPSAALIKATMVNSAVNMSGTNSDGPIPSTGQGWGRILLDNSLYFESDDHLLFISDEQSGVQTGQSNSYTLFSDGQSPVKVTLVWTDYYPSLSSGVQLVNDLDLTVVGPQTQYKGNVFSGGISSTGGLYDRLNVVENVVLPNPETGSFTITVSGFNVPYGPQPYALVVTGLTKGSSAATLSLDKTSYRPGQNLIVTLNDLDLNSGGQTDFASVHISSTGDSGQDITLTETNPDSGTFQGTFVVNSVVAVNEGDTITVEYTDQDNGEGSSETIEAAATVDGIAPTIGEVTIEQISRYSAVVSWQTGEPTTGTLFYLKQGESEWLEIASGVAQHHSITLEELDAGTLYQLKIEVSDLASNSTIVDNSGTFYTFSTDIEETILLENAEGGSSFFQLSGGSNSAGENGLWHITTFSSNSGSSSWYYGRETTKTYDTGFRNWGHITSAVPIDLTNCVGAELRLNHILKTEEFSPYDTGKVEVSEDNITFTTLHQSVKTDVDWEELSITLDNYVGKQIYIRFSFDTDDEMFNGYQGWLIDDIRVVTFHKKKGDINGDGKIDLADILLSLQVAIGSTEGSAAIQIEGDVDGDGRIGIIETISAMRTVSQ